MASRSPNRSSAEAAAATTEAATAAPAAPVAPAVELEVLPYPGVAVDENTKMKQSKINAWLPLAAHGQEGSSAPWVETSMVITGQQTLVFAAKTAAGKGTIRPIRLIGNRPIAIRDGVGPLPVMPDVPAGV